MAYTFIGGIRMDEYKTTRRLPIERMPAPAKITVPMSQHIGAPCIPVVSVGDRVERGQVIGEIERGLGCPVHSGISGIVEAIIERNTATGAKVVNIVIANDGEYRISPSVRPCDKPVGELTAEEIIDVVRRAGISGMGGATFPTYAKISSALGKVSRLIVNCAECEPFITANHRLMLEQPEAVVGGAKILLKAFGLRSGIIAVEDNKLDAANVLQRELGTGGLLNVKIVKTKYPQGDERQLIFALTGTELPPGKLPADIGCVVFNTETCAAVYTAFSTGMPLVERVVTVSGDCVKRPANLLVTIGTSCTDVIDFCGGLVRPAKKLIFGGPMMGAAQWDINSPITKGTSALLLLSGKFKGNQRYEQEPTCIRCGKCVASCQMHLMPNYLAMFSAAGKYDLCEEYGALSCVECGCCSYLCPGQVPIVQHIRSAKAKIMLIKKGGAGNAK